MFGNFRRVKEATQDLGGNWAHFDIGLGHCIEKHQENHLQLCVYHICRQPKQMLRRRLHPRKLLGIFQDVSTSKVYYSTLRNHETQPQKPYQEDHPERQGRQNNRILLGSSK